MNVAATLKIEERDSLLKATEEALVPPQYRVMPKLETGQMYDAQDPSMFVAAFSRLMIGSVLSGIPNQRPKSIANVLLFTDTEVESFLRGQSRTIEDISDALPETLRDPSIRRQLKSSGHEVHTDLLTSEFIANALKTLLHLISSIVPRDPQHPNSPQDFRYFLSLPFFRRRKNIPAPDTERLSLVKRLVLLRLQRSVDARLAFAVFGLSLSEMQTEVLMTSAEASIMRIVEQYLAETEKDANDDIVIPVLNRMHSLLLSAAGQDLPQMVSPFSLHRYIDHFLSHVHSHGATISRDFIPIAVQEVQDFYGR
jgi:hypothetical protein